MLQPAASGLTVALRLSGSVSRRCCSLAARRGCLVYPTVMSDHRSTVIVPASGSRHRTSVDGDGPVRPLSLVILPLAAGQGNSDWQSGFASWQLNYNPTRPKLTATMPPHLEGAAGRNRPYYTTRCRRLRLLYHLDSRRNPTVTRKTGNCYFRFRVSPSMKFGNPFVRPVGTGSEGPRDSGGTGFIPVGTERPARLRLAALYCPDLSEAPVPC
jgi:hypothetical protein